MEEIIQKKLSIISILLLVVVGVGTFWVFNKGVFIPKENFVISDVPFITIYNHTGKNAYLVTSPAAALVTVLEYYGANFSDADYRNINNKFFDPEDMGMLYVRDDIKNYAEQLGYDTKVEVTGSLSDLKKYINPTSKTPIIIGHLLDNNQNPLIKQSPVGVLIGVLEKENAIVIHDYYWGYNKKIGWEDFKKMASSRYLVIQPKNHNNVDRKKVVYLERTTSMDMAEPLINKITLGRVAIAQQQRRIALDYFKEATTDKNFKENVPPYYKVAAYSGIATGQLMVVKNLDRALEFALMAKTLNHDLNKPFGDYWPGFEDRTNSIINEYSGSYFVLGMIYEAKKELGLAREAYQKAISVWPDHVLARDALEKLIKK